MKNPDKVPYFNRIDAEVALDKAKSVVVRLRAMRDAKTEQQFNNLRMALKFDKSSLDLALQTL